MNKNILLKFIRYNYASYIYVVHTYTYTYTYTYIYIHTYIYIYIYHTYYNHRSFDMANLLWADPWSSSRAGAPPRLEWAWRSKGSLGSPRWPRRWSMGRPHFWSKRVEVVEASNSSIKYVTIEVIKCTSVSVVIIMLIMSIIGAEVADPSPDPSQFRHNDAPVTDRPPRDSGALWRCLDGLAGRSSKDLDIRQPKNSGFRKRNLLLESAVPTSHLRWQRSGMETQSSWQEMDVKGRELLRTTRASRNLETLLGNHFLSDCCSFPSCFSCPAVLCVKWFPCWGCWRWRTPAAPSSCPWSIAKVAHALLRRGQRCSWDALVLSGLAPMLLMFKVPAISSTNWDGKCRGNTFLVSYRFLT